MNVPLSVLVAFVLLVVAGFVAFTKVKLVPMSVPFIGAIIVPLTGISVPFAGVGVVGLVGVGDVPLLIVESVVLLLDDEGDPGDKSTDLTYSNDSPTLSLSPLK